MYRLLRSSWPLFLVVVVTAIMLPRPSAAQSTSVLIEDIVPVSGVRVVGRSSNSEFQVRVGVPAVFDVRYRIRSTGWNGRVILWGGLIKCRTVGPRCIQLSWDTVQMNSTRVVDVTVRVTKVFWQEKDHDQLTLIENERLVERSSKNFSFNHQDNFIPVRVLPAPALASTVVKKVYASVAFIIPGGETLYRERLQTSELLVFGGNHFRLTADPSLGGLRLECSSPKIVRCDLPVPSDLVDNFEYREILSLQLKLSFPNAGDNEGNVELTSWPIDGTEPVRIVYRYGRGISAGTYLQPRSGILPHVCVSTTRKRDVKGPITFSISLDKDRFLNQGVSLEFSSAPGSLRSTVPFTVFAPGQQVKRSQIARGRFEYEIKIGAPPSDISSTIQPYMEFNYSFSGAKEGELARFEMDGIGKTAAIGYLFYRDPNAENWDFSKGTGCV